MIDLPEPTIQEAAEWRAEVEPTLEKMVWRDGE